MHRLPIPPSIFEQHTAVLGKTRSGKSSVLRLLVEWLLANRRPVCIIDPKGDWWGIKLAANGKSPGFPVVIFGGHHADVPINQYAGAHVAELFSTGNRSMLLDLSTMMPGERTQFWIAFAAAMFQHTRGHRWLVIDEIHNFAPKTILHGGVDSLLPKSLHWVNRLASEGLGKGIGMLFASQRPQKVHNDTLSSAETLIAMRVLHPSDRNAVKDWIDSCGDPAMGKDVLATLAQLQRGEGWAWSPEVKFGPKRVQFPLFSTYDSFRPQTSADAKRLKGWASVDLDEVKDKLAAFVQEAADNDPALLKRQIAQLKSAKEELTAGFEKMREQAQAKPAKLPPKQKFKYIPCKVLATGQAERIEKIGQSLRQSLVEIYDSAQQRISEAREKIIAQFSKIEAKIGLIEEFDQGAAKELAQADARIGDWATEAKNAATGIRNPPINIDLGQSPAAVVTTRRRSSREAYRSEQAVFQPGVHPLDLPASNGIPGGEKEALEALIQSGSAGLTMSGVCIHTRKAMRSVQSYISRLSVKNLIDKKDGRIFANPAGRAAMPHVQPLPADPDKLQKHWIEHLPGGEVDLFKFLLQVQPNWPTVAELPERLGMAQRTVQSYTSRLNTREVIEVYVGEDKKKRIKLTGELESLPF